MATATTDINHASDLIRRKLMKENPSHAQRFANLYTKLLSLPVLNQKWAMLYLLLQLSDSADPNDPTSSFHQPVLQAQPIAPGKPTQAVGHFGSRPASLVDSVPGSNSGAANIGSELRTDSLLHPKEQQPPPGTKESLLRSTEQGRHFKSNSPLGPVAKRAEDEAFNEAFAPGGLKHLPPTHKVKDSPASHYYQDDKAPKDKAKPEIHGRSERTAAPPRSVSIKNSMLADNFAAFQPSELVLLRDLPYTLQGLSSTSLPFEKKGDNTLSLPPTLPVSIISLLNTLAEPSLLCRQLTEWVKTQPNGLLHQSLRAAVDVELRSYLSLVAALEAQIRRALATIAEDTPRNGIGKAGVTLKRCVVWTREATMGLRLMSVIAEESKSKRGGPLITLIHGFSSSHGDPVVGAFAERLLSQVTRPFYDILRRWIYEGELSDPFQEFFVREKNEVVLDTKAAKKVATSVWDSKYELSTDMVPSILTHDFAERVFLIGKSLNFIRHSCGDAAWVEQYSHRAVAAREELRYGDASSLSAWVDEAHDITQMRLMSLMDTRFHVFQHLKALKDYILLGQGDFIALLMESLASNLDRPAGAQYRHTLTAQLEHAIRGSNAQYDSPEVLRRLDARMLQLSHGEIGWDCFTLEYKIDAPVDVVVTDWGNRQYLKVFNFLWRIKRVEFALHRTWRKCMTGARGVLLNKFATQDNRYSTCGSGTDNGLPHYGKDNDEDEADFVWKQTRGTLAEMIHFVGQLQYYILFEVIEASWSELQRNIRREGCTLDELLQAHTKFLTDVTNKGLLGPKKRPSPGGSYADNHSGGKESPTQSMHGDETTPYLNHLSELLRIMLLYRDSVDGLYSWSVSEFARRREFDLRTANTASSKVAAGNSARPGTASGVTADRLTRLKLGNSGSRPGSSQSHSSHISSNSADLGSVLGAGSLTGAEALEGIAQVHSEFPELQRSLRQLSASFRGKLQLLLGELAMQPDADMKFLGTAMNFNDVYQPVVRKGNKSGAGGHSRAAADKHAASKTGTVSGGDVGGESYQGHEMNHFNPLATTSFGASKPSRAGTGQTAMATGVAYKKENAGTSSKPKPSGSR